MLTFRVQRFILCSLSDGREINDDENAMIVIALTPKAGREGNPEVWGIVSMVMPSMIGGNGSCTHSHTYTHRNMHTYAYNYLPSLLSLIKFPLLVNEENFNKLR